MQLTAEQVSEILQAVEIETAIPAGQQVEIANKILRQEIVGVRLHELLLARFGGDILESLHPLERTAIVNRVAPKAIFKPVVWGIGQITVSGLPFAQAECPMCSKIETLTVREAHHAFTTLPNGQKQESFKKYSLTESLVQAREFKFRHCGGIKVETMPSDCYMIYEQRLSAYAHNGDTNQNYITSD